MRRSRWWQEKMAVPGNWFCVSLSLCRSSCSSSPIPEGPFWPHILPAHPPTISKPFAIVLARLRACRQPARLGPLTSNLRAINETMGAIKGPQNLLGLVVNGQVMLSGDCRCPADKAWPILLGRHQQYPKWRLKTASWDSFLGSKRRVVIIHRDARSSDAPSVPAVPYVNVSFLLLAGF